MKSVHEGEPTLITKRKPTLLTRRECLRLAALGTLGLIAIEGTITRNSQEYNAYLDEKAKNRRLSS